MSSYLDRTDFAPTPWRDDHPAYRRVGPQSSGRPLGEIAHHVWDPRYGSLTDVGQPKYSELLTCGQGSSEDQLRGFSNAAVALAELRSFITGR